MRFASVCSGIEAASLAWEPLSGAVPVMRWIGRRIRDVNLATQFSSTRHGSGQAESEQRG